MEDRTTPAGEDLYVEHGKHRRLRVPCGLRGGLLALAVPAVAFAAFGMGWASSSSAQQLQTQLQLTTEQAAASNELAALARTNRSRTAAPACLTSAYTVFCQFSRMKRRGFDIQQCMRSPESAWKSALTAAAGDEEKGNKPVASKAGAHWPFLKRVAEMHRRYGCSVSCGAWLGEQDTVEGEGGLERNDAGTAGIVMWRCRYGQVKIAVGEGGRGHRARLFPGIYPVDL